MARGIRSHNIPTNIDVDFNCNKKPRKLATVPKNLTKLRRRTAESENRKKTEKRISV